jgi:hypothetical protein
LCATAWVKRPETADLGFRLAEEANVIRYTPRTIAYNGILLFNDWRLKHYSISRGEQYGAETDWSGAIAQLLSFLPTPANTNDRPGIGFLIIHAGVDALYAVLAFWDRENELSVRICVREPTGAWRMSRDSESFCVWDLEVFWHERNAYIDTVLSERGDPKGEEYLKRPFRQAVADACS